MKVTLKDGSVKEYAQPMAVIDIAKDISEGLARMACVAEINGEEADLRTVVDSDCQLNILTAKDAEGLAALRHTASHVMAQAIKRLWPDTKLAIGPSIAKECFVNCMSLQEIELPEGLEEIGKSAFEGCSSLQSVILRGETMPVSLTRVAYHAFRDCTALTQITLPVTVSRIGAAAFENCEALQLLEIYAKRCTFVSSTSVPTETVISGYAGSTAQTYAAKFNREFVELGTASTSSVMTTALTTTSLTQTTTTTTTASSKTSAVTSTTPESFENRLIGDVNGDGNCTIDDLVMLNQYLLGILHADASQIAAMDCCADGKIDMRDSLILEQFLVYMIDTIPVEP